ncbi:hypothetical protein JYU02_00645 [bacterium AH-315-P15]|nr:hypothetical protein [bacterium AH-315-P15]
MSSPTQPDSIGKLEMFGAVGLFAILVAAALGKEFGYIDGYVAKRIFGIIFGVVLVIMGNFLPKIVRPLSAQHSDPVKVLAAERFAGRTFVLAGIAYISVWVFAPPENAMLISSLVGLGAFALVATNWVWLIRGELPRNQQETKSDKIRHAMFQILFALFWVFAIFLADSLWGDHISRPMGIAYVFALVFWGALSANKARLRKRHEPSP